MSFQSAFFQLAKLTCIKAHSGSGLIPFPGFPFGVSITVYLVAFQEPMRPLKFLTLLCRHARRSDPDRSSGISPCENLRSMFVFSVCRLVSRRCHRISIIASAYRFLCRGFRFVNNVATGLDTFNEAEIASGWCDTPLAYRLLGLRFTALVHR